MRRAVRSGVRSDIAGFLSLADIALQIVGRAGDRDIAHQATSRTSPTVIAAASVYATGRTRLRRRTDPSVWIAPIPSRDGWLHLATAAGFAGDAGGCAPRDLCRAVPGARHGAGRPR